jgi:Rrf2 family transcriptional regulator, cysteine metabolism repressor
VISQRCHYALKAILQLALHEGKGSLTIGQIAKAQGIPVRFLEAILRQLKQAGLAKSTRGKAGGYALGRAARSISVRSVISALEGPLFLVKAKTSDRSRPEVFDAIWGRASNAVDNILEEATFSDLAQEYRDRSGIHSDDYAI